MAEGPDDENSLSYQSLRPPEYLHFNEKHPPPSPLSSCPNTPQRSVASSIGMDSLDRHPELTVPSLPVRLQRSKSTPLPKKIAVPKSVTTSDDEQPSIEFSPSNLTEGSDDKNIREQEEKKDNEDEMEEKLRASTRREELDEGGRRPIKATIVTESSIARTFKITRSQSNISRSRLRISGSTESDDETASIHNTGKKEHSQAPQPQQRKRPLPPRSPVNRSPSPVNGAPSSSNNSNTYNTDCPDDEKARTPNLSKSQSSRSRPPLPTPPSTNCKTKQTTTIDEAPDDEGKIVSSQKIQGKKRYDDMDTPDDEEISDPGRIIKSKSPSRKNPVLVPGDDVPIDEMIPAAAATTSTLDRGNASPPKSSPPQMPSSSSRSSKAGHEAMASTKRTAWEDSGTTPKATTAYRALKQENVLTDEKQQGSPMQVRSIRSPGTTPTLDKGNASPQKPSPPQMPSISPRSSKVVHEALESRTRTTREGSGRTPEARTASRALKQQNMPTDEKQQGSPIQVRRVRSPGTTGTTTTADGNRTSPISSYYHIAEGIPSPTATDTASSEAVATRSPPPENPRSTNLDSQRKNKDSLMTSSISAKAVSSYYNEEEDQVKTAVIRKPQKPAEPEDSVLGSLWKAAESTTLAATDTAYFATEAGIALLSGGAAAGKLLETLVLGPEDDNENVLAKSLLAAKKTPPSITDSSLSSSSMSPTAPAKSKGEVDNTRSKKTIPMTRSSGGDGVNASSGFETSDAMHNLSPSNQQQSNNFKGIQEEEVEVELTLHDNGNGSHRSMELPHNGALPITSRVNSSISSLSSPIPGTRQRNRENVQDALDAGIPINISGSSTKSVQTTSFEQRVIQRNIEINQEIPISKKTGDISYTEAAVTGKTPKPAIGPSFDESSIDEAGGSTGQNKLLIPVNSDPEVAIYDSEDDLESEILPPPPLETKGNAFASIGLADVREKLVSPNKNIPPLSPRSPEPQHGYAGSDNGFISPVLSDDHYSATDTLNFSLDDDHSEGKFLTGLALPKDPLAENVQYIPMDEHGKPFIPENIVNLSPSKPSSSSKDVSLLDTVTSFDDVYGVAKGDTMLSLLSSKFGQTSPDTDGSVQVRNAIQRMRDLGRTNGLLPPRNYGPDSTSVAILNAPNSPVTERLECHNDGAETISKLHRRALSSMKHDDFDGAAEFYEDIVAFSSGKLKQQEKQEKQPSNIDDAEPPVESIDYKSVVGTALYNLAIIFLLKEDYEEASDLFKQASEIRESCFGNEHVDHIPSLVNLALCYFAMNDFLKSRKILLGALELCKQKRRFVSDFTQLAEILNNLGCLSFLLGNLGICMKVFTESIQVQTALQNRLVYVGTRHLRQAVCLNITVASSNLGYVQLCIRDHLAATKAFEGAIVHQENLMDDSHETLIATMEYLVIANFLAGNKQRALQILTRLHDAHVGLYGEDDSRCELLVKRMHLIDSNGDEYKDKIERQLQVPGPKKASALRPSMRTFIGKR